MLNFLEPLRWARRLVSAISEQVRWAKQGFSVPTPGLVKRSGLRRHGFKDATWVETGTFTGVTTNFLAKVSQRVVSIEPEPELFRKAKERFAEMKNVEIIHGLSEDVFPELLPTLQGKVNFWLDGHYSAGPTHLGPQKTPITDELKSISKNIKNFDGVCVIVDDIRGFGNTPLGLEDPDYPDIDTLVVWANSNDLPWTIEHDMFIAKSRDIQEAFEVFDIKKIV